MKTILRSSLAVVLGAGTALAATGGDPTLSPLVVMLLFFGGLIIAFQLVPGLFLFFSMVKGLFSASAKETDVLPAETEREA